MILLTAATGKLGAHVVDALLQKLPPSQLAVAVRDVEKAKSIAARGVQVRYADYGKPETLSKAFAGVKKLLLISSNEIGQRAPQHQSVIAAAVAAGVSHLAYTSVLRADVSTLGLAGEHVATEQALRASGLKFTLLRNGWYFENYTENLASALQHGVIMGAAKDGKIAAASRRDFAEAAAAVLLGDGHEGKVYELAGDAPFTMTEFAAVVAELSGKPVRYQDLPFEAYRDALTGFGLPAPLAQLLADSDVGISNGQLDDSTGDLRRLIGRPTTSLRTAIAAALR